jgi:hypothetical protein
MRLLKSFRNRCEVISTELRRTLGLEVFDRLPADKLAKHYEVTISSPEKLTMSKEAIEYCLTNHDWWGFLIQPGAPNKPMIIYDPKQSPARYEATIMHELAHLILGHPPERIYFAPDGTFTRNFDPKKEREAAYLGSCLQIPRRGLLWAIQRGMNNEQIAGHYCASLEMVRWRLNAVNSTHI